MAALLLVSCAETKYVPDGRYLLDEVTLAVDGKYRDVGPGDAIMIRPGEKHTIIAETRLQVIEVQYGEAIDVHDKIKHEL